MSTTQAEARLVLHNEAALTGRTLCVGFGSHELADRYDTLELDYAAARASGGTFGAWLPAARYDTIAIALPKAHERTRMLLAQCAGKVVLAGRNDAGIRSAPALLREVASSVEVLDYRFHGRAFIATGLQAASFDRDAWRAVVRWRELQVVSYPGVFAHGRIDPATEMLLDVLDVARGARVLDAGCGNGVISAWCATRSEASVVAVDTDALALESARSTCEGLAVEVRASDLYSDVGETFDVVVSNPPFHAGVRTTNETAQRIIREAPAREIWIVCNRFLDYGAAFRDAFGEPTLVTEDARYRVWRARR